MKGPEPVPAVGVKVSGRVKLAPPGSAELVSVNSTVSAFDGTAEASAATSKIPAITKCLRIKVPL
jgi:hypothetical protein